MRRFLSIFLFLVVFNQASALSVVLVHGFLDNGATWWRAGIAQQLLTLPVKVYTPSLPASAPLLVQAAILNDFLARLRLAESQEPLVLVGHSAGGLVARAALLQQPWLNKDLYSFNNLALITIATPHTSTDRAFFGAQLLRTPLGLLPPALGFGELTAGTRLLEELGDARPGSLLFALNTTPHPPVRYVSLVRSNAIPFGDFLVPSFSQDLRAVPAIAQVYPVETIVSGSGHFLEFSDGVILRGILAQLLLKSPPVLPSP
jgi:pimeloyl-ACP methyl ester carboxylesterase